MSGYPQAGQPGCWGLLTSTQLARLCQELDRTLYTDCHQLVDWLATTCRVPYSVSGLTDLRHRLGYSCKWTTVVPCAADAAVQTAFLADTLLPLLEAADAGTAAVCFADVAHPTHHVRASYV